MTTMIRINPKGRPNGRLAADYHNYARPVAVLWIDANTIVQLSALPGHIDATSEWLHCLADQARLLAADVAKHGRATP